MIKDYEYVTYCTSFTPQMIKLTSEIYFLEHRNRIVTLNILQQEFKNFEKFKQTVMNLVKTNTISYSIAEYYINMYIDEMNTTV